MFNCLDTIYWRVTDGWTDTLPSQTPRYATRRAGKNIVVLVWPGAAHAPIAVYSRLTSVFRTTLIGVCKILSRSVEIWQYEDQKSVLE